MKNYATPRSFLAALAAIVLTLALLAGAAHAGSGRVMQEVTTTNPTGGIAKGDHIYFGTKDEANYTWTDSAPYWRVLDASKTNSDEDGMFLLSEKLIGNKPGGSYGNVYFDDSGNDSNVWQNSTARRWCGTFLTKVFSQKEQDAIIATTISDKVYTPDGYLVFEASPNILNGDKVFFLSAEEAENADYGFNTDSSRIADYGSNAGNWWLRSPNASQTSLTSSAGLVCHDGVVRSENVHYSGWGRAVRPAFNLDLGSVLFTSAAAGGKSAAAEGGRSAGGEIFEIPETATKEWKLTLKDDSRAAFSASMTAASAKEVTFSWEGAETGRDEWISAVIMDADGNVKYYGRIAQPKKAKGTATVKMPRKLGKTDRLWVFNEQYNGDKKTDYASPLVELAALPDGTVGVKYKSQELEATELTAPLEWKLVKKTKKDRLPAGLKLSRAGKISGTPREAGTFAFTVQVTDASGQSATKALLLTVEKGGGPAAPEGLVATPPTAQGMTDGTISGVDPTMEWSADDGETWTDCPATGPITGLAPGDYLVRYKATEKAGPGDAATVTVPESGAHVVTVRLIDGGDGGPVVVLELTSDGGPVAGRDLWAWLVPAGDGKEQGAFLGTTDIEGRLILDVDDLTLVTGGKAVIPAGTWRIRIEIRDADGELWTGVSSDTVSLPATSTRSGGGCFNVGFGGLAMMALAGAATRRRR